MKKFALLACILLFSGCTVKYPESVNLSLQVAPQSSAVYTESTASLRGHDARSNPEIVVFRVANEPVVKVQNINSPHVVITEQLAGGLQGQGLEFKSNAPVRIRLDLNQLLVTVTRSNMLYNSEAVSQVTLEVKNTKTSLKKLYTRNDSQSSVSRPGIDKIEKMLSDQLSTIVNQILMDAEFRKMIAGL